MCPRCGGLLEVNYDYGNLGGEVTKKRLEMRRIRSIWRYAEFLPIDPEYAVTLGEGFTPLLKSKTLGRSTGLRCLHLKLDYVSPTGSFKDRGASTMVSKAKELKVDAVAIDSSGNAAASVAAYSAREGLRCYVFAPSYASPGKLVQSLAYGSKVFAVEGTRRDTYETANAAYRRFGWYYCGFQTNPYATEGLKTVAYEVCEQLDWNSPDRIVIPVGTGGNLVGCWKGLRELHDIGWISHLPSLICIQPEGCAPIANAYKRGIADIHPIERPETVAEGLMIANPIKGKLALKVLSETDGIAETVTDGEIIEAGRRLARDEGLFVEPSAAASMAGIIKLVDRGLISSDETVICILTGSGLKVQDAYSKVIGKAITIRPRIDDVEREISKSP